MFHFFSWHDIVLCPPPKSKLLPERDISPQLEKTEELWEALAQQFSSRQESGAAISGKLAFVINGIFQIEMQETKLN